MSTTIKPAIGSTVVAGLIHPINGFHLMVARYTANAPAPWQTVVGDLSDSQINSWIAIGTVKALSYTN